MQAVFILLGALLVCIAVLFAHYFTLPHQDHNEVSPPESFLIQTPNRMDRQSKNECAAFSSAFVLRSLGIDTDGAELYHKFPKKFPDGTIAPKGIVQFFGKRGFHVRYLKGDVSTLKAQVAKGVPVIVLIRTWEKRRSLHYIPVVGYDRGTFYLADSLGFTRNCSEPFYNRKIPANEFERLWRIGVPLHKNTYFVISKE